MRRWIDSPDTPTQLTPLGTIMVEQRAARPNWSPWRPFFVPVHLREYRAVSMEACWNAADLLLQTRPANCPIDGVGILTILNKPEGPELLLQKQYRPPIDMVVVEVPAGLIDAGESPEECAVRELKEETGYVGVAEETSPVMYNGMFVDSGSHLSFLFLSFLFFLRMADSMPRLRPWSLQYQSEYGPCARGHDSSREPESKAATRG